MEESRKSNAGRIVASTLVAFASFWVCAVLSPAYAYDYGRGSYGSGAYNVGQLDPTTTVLTSGTNPSTVGTSVRFTATVTPGTATGTITFKNGGTTFGTATLGQGSGSVTTSALTVGSHSLIAVYGGNVSFSGSTSHALTQVVNAIPTSGGGLGSNDGSGGGGGGGGGRRSVTGSIPGSTGSATSPLSGADTGSDLPQQNGFLAEFIGGNVVVLRDVPTNRWFASYVHQLIEAGIVTGYKTAAGKPSGLFGPANNVTEAEILKMALLSVGKGGSKGTPVNRSARGDWSAVYVKTAEALHLSIYTPALDVRLPATRGQVIQTILEASGTPITVGDNPFSDLRSSSPYAPAVETAFRLGILSGDTDANGQATGTVRPNDSINRAEAAKIIALVRGVLKK